MAITTGRVVQVIIAPDVNAEVVCVLVGSSLRSAELFNIKFLSSDSAFATENKRLMVKWLVLAFTSRREIRVSHRDNDAHIIGVEFPRPNISPVGPAIHNDFYSITGANIPADAEVVFDSGALSTIVTPDLRRPYWILIEQLPSVIPPGPCTVSLRAPGWQSDQVPVTVTSDPPQTVRTLYSGRPATEPYTFVFAASPAIQQPGASGTLSADPVLTARVTFHDVVGHCLENLLTVTEGLLRTENLEASIRFVAIFDTTQGVTLANALVQELTAVGNILDPVQDRLNGFAARYWENPDIMFCISGSTTHTRARAKSSTDDASRPGVDYTYDGTPRKHGRFTEIPGCAALSTAGLDVSGLTALHEFGHAASDRNNGFVMDLYVPETFPAFFIVNKKMRANTTDPIPTDFGNYNGTIFQSDQNRDGLGYPSSWASYHPALRDATRPNLMDDYWLAGPTADERQRCQLDELTFIWFLDRLRAKILR